MFFLSEFRFLSQVEIKIQEKEEKPKQATDFFKITKATPAIYYLPLTEEQVSRVGTWEYLKGDLQEKLLKWIKLTNGGLLYLLLMLSL